MKRILVLLIIFSNIAFSEIVLDKSKSIPIKYAPTSATVDGEGNIYSVSSFIGMVVKYIGVDDFEVPVRFGSSPPPSRRR